MIGIGDRVVLLINQGRNQEAKKLLEDHLDNNPENDALKYYYAFTLLRLGENDKSREITDMLMTANPEDARIMELSIDIDIKDELLQKAESKAEIYIDMDPGNASAYLSMAQVKVAQNNYDKTQYFVDKALEIDPENISALNLKIMVQGILGEEDTNASIDTALELQPENASTVANHGIQLLREGKTDEALERLEYALSLEPTNYLARYGMLEAMKNKFWPYRMLFKFKMFCSKLTAKGSWGLIIGFYIVYQIILSVARSMPHLEPFLMPIVYAMFGFFILTWILDPLMNIYLQTNKYGKLLLEKDDKKMANLCGIALIGAILSLLFMIVSPRGAWMAMIFGLSLIPLGTFLNPTQAKNQKKTTYFTIGLVTIGLLALLTGGDMIIFGFIIAVFAYQWYFNSVMIGENARVMD